MIHLALFGIDAGLGVVLTYLVHSTAWITAALLLTRLHRQLSPAARHALCRAALVGPLASSALAPAWCRCWEWSLVQPSVTVGVLLHDLPRVAQQPFARAFTSPTVPPVIGAARPSGSWLTAYTACWALVALFGLALLARAAVRQRRALESRAFAIPFGSATATA